MTLTFRTARGPHPSRLDPHVARIADVTAARPGRFLRRSREIVAVIEPWWPAEATAEPTASIKAPRDVLERAATDLVPYLKQGEVVAATDDGYLKLRLRHDDRAARPIRLQELAYHCVEVLAAAGFKLGLIDLGVGWARITRRSPAPVAERQARAAAHDSSNQRDLQPRHHDGTRRDSGVRVNWRSASRQVFVATVGSVVVPFLVLVGLYHLGVDPSGALYWVLVVALAVTAVSIWAECLHALDPPRPPARAERPAPRASAVIAAYLPNEADTIVETLQSFLAQEYGGGLQVILAYNSPTALAVEDELRTLARQHESLTVLNVTDSTSKAQNVNAAIRVADGEFVGIFDADHHPMPGAFDRAWRWISDGVDVVQGHCVIRNGESSWLARLVAVEFETIYAVAHPGRADLHGFGIFGGSNGYWSRAALERIRMRGSFLTEDIEASMRLLQNGGRIVNDPGLISYELAPESPAALWKQRMRWSQGWFQVSCRHLWSVLRSPHLSTRQKVGSAYLLGWREVYPWVSLMAWPLIGFIAWRDGGLDFSSPLFALVTLFVLASGPLQVITAWRLAAPQLRQHPSWFAFALVANVTVYTEAKNLVNRIAHLKQVRGEHQWVVTPRSASTTAATSAGHAEEVA